MIFQLADDALSHQAEEEKKRVTSFQAEILRNLMNIIKTLKSVAQGDLPHHTIMGCLFQAAQTRIT